MKVLTMKPEARPTAVIEAADILAICQVLHGDDHPYTEQARARLAALLDSRKPALHLVAS